MDSFPALRIAAIVVAWGTVLGGALMGVIWSARGGLRATGPDDELLAETGVETTSDPRRVTSFSPAQVGVHGLLGVLTASLVTYAATYGDDRTPGYVALLVAIAVTAIPGALMFSKWRSGQRPAVQVAAAPGSRRVEPRVEDHIPGPLAYLHGLGVLTTVVLIAVLLVVD